MKGEWESTGKLRHIYDFPFAMRQLQSVNDLMQTSTPPGLEINLCSSPSFRHLWSHQNRIIPLYNK